MSPETRYLLAMTCVLPALVGFYQYRKMQPQYHLIIYMLLMDAATETIDFIGKKNDSFKPISDCWANVYMLLSLGLFLSFVKNNGYIKKRLLQVLIAVAVMVAAFTFYKMGSPLKNFYFPLLCFVYAVQLFVATDILSKQVTVVNMKLTRNFWFWASCLFILQNAYGLLVFSIYYFNLAETPSGKIIGMLTLYVNIFYYCAMALVLLLVPQKKTIFINQIS
jgi:hypothetical protein